MDRRSSTVATIMAPVTFTIDAQDCGGVVASLTELGFVFEPARQARTTTLDTFDGRLHRAGLLLDLDELDESGRLELTLSGRGVVPARVGVVALPRSPGDLPVGPFRSRLERITGLRALMPQMERVTRRRAGAWCNDDGKIVARAFLENETRLLMPASSAALPVTLEIHDVAGYPKWAQRAVERVAALGVARTEGDTAALYARAAGVDSGGFRSSPAVPLDPAAPAVEGFRMVLANLARTIRANWQGTIDQMDTEFLHDLRIALRRTRTVLGAAKGVLAPDVRDGARERFGWLAGLTGPARDLDVYLLEWDLYVNPLEPGVASALAPVRSLLMRRTVNAHAELEAALRSEGASDFIGGWTRWLSEPIGETDRERYAGRPMGVLVAKRIARHHAIVIERGSLIEPTTPADEVHGLRKDAKRLRYLVECFGSLLPDASRRRFVNRLKALQDNLGAFQDAEVHAAMLRGVAQELHEAGASADTMVAIGQLAERLDRQRLDARAEFAERFAAFDTRAARRALKETLAAIAP
ncbi:MAG: CHAD domain-containing protein [Acidimicrobiales bacterium]